MKTKFDLFDIVQPIAKSVTHLGPVEVRRIWVTPYGEHIDGVSMEASSQQPHQPKFTINGYSAALFRRIKKAASRKDLQSR